jgi:endo-1,3(4)-beta-glucanase
VVTLNNGQSWIVYSSTPINFHWKNNSLVANSPFSGSLRIVCRSESVHESILDKFSSVIPTGGEVDYNIVIVIIFSKLSVLE